MHTVPIVKSGERLLTLHTGHSKKNFGELKTKREKLFFLANETLSLQNFGRTPLAGERLPLWAA